MNFNEWLVREFGTIIPMNLVGDLEKVWNAALENQWVNIDLLTPKQELPDCGVDVIAWDGFDCARAWVNAKGKWCSYEEPKDFCVNTITHWMSIPELKK